MSVDMRLISIRDGGRFAMSWLAGTNPKALRASAHRTHVYTLDVPEVCKDIMKCIKRKNNSISFRILYRLCFGTIRIFSEQVQHLYNVTLNFVCFNAFFLKQYSRKRTRATGVDNDNKRRRMGSIDSVELTNLLMESEVFNEYSEEKFEFPQEVNSTGDKKKTTSTCIHIKQITIRQISWDCPQPDEEDAFGEASQDERNMLLYEMSAREDDQMSQQSSVRQKRKSPTPNDSSPVKRSCLESTLDNSIEEIRCAPSSIIDETVSEFNIDYRSQSVAENPTATQDANERDLPLNETFPNQQVDLDVSQLQCDIPPESPNVLSVQPIEANTSLQQMPTLIPDVKRKARKRPKSHLIIDKYTKLAKIDLDHCRNNVWENCFNSGRKEHIVNRFSSAPLTSLYSGPARFPRLLGRFKKNFKTVQKQIVDAENRLLLIEEILGDDFETYRSEFKLTTAKRSRSSAVNALQSCSQFRHIVEDTPMLPVNDENIDLNNNCREFEEGPGVSRIQENTVTLKCPLEKIDLNKIKFNFPNDAANQRSNWGKEGILRKLLSLWKKTDAHVSMATLIIGASRINAALAFHTLLDLAGQQYVDIITDDNNSIKFINMGPEMIRKINKQCR